MSALDTSARQEVVTTITLSAERRARHDVQRKGFHDPAPRLFEPKMADGVVFSQD